MSNAAESNNRKCGDEGCIIKGKRHGQCDKDGCGEEFPVNENKFDIIEAEEGEAIIIPEAFDYRCFADSYCPNPAHYKITGTIKQVASAINALGGGQNFAPGAKILKNGRKLKTPKLTVKNSRVPKRKIESGSVIINRTNMNNPKILTFEGTSIEIANQINTYGGNGVPIEEESSYLKESGGKVDEKRYVATIEMYIYASSDKKAKQLAKEQSDKLDSNLQPELVSLKPKFTAHKAGEDILKMSGGFVGSLIPVRTERSTVFKKNDTPVARVDENGLIVIYEELSDKEKEILREEAKQKKKVPFIQRPSSSRTRSRNIDKYEAEKELREKGFQFGWLTPVSNRFNPDSYEKDSEKYDNFELYTRKISKNKVQRAIKTNNDDWFWLTK